MSRVLPSPDSHERDCGGHVRQGRSGGAIGQPITINIIAATGSSKTFDNVTLDAISVVPEPATLALQGVGGLCLALLAYRRRRRQA